MKKAIYLVGGISFGGIVLFSLGSLSSANNFFSDMGVCAFIAAALNIGVGILLLLISIGAKEVRPYAASCLLVAGLLLLCGFTLCSNTHANMGHM